MKKRKIYIVILVITSLLLNTRLANASERPQQWFHPNYFDVKNVYAYFSHPLNTLEWGNYFADESQYAPTLKRIDVMGFFMHQLTLNRGNFLQNLVPKLNKYNVAIATEGGYIGTYGCQNGHEGITTANNELADVQPLYDAGGKIDYLGLDGFLGFIIAPSSNMTPIITSNPSVPSCGYTVDQAIPELISYMKRWHEVHPETKMGLIVSLPTWKYNGVPNYMNSGITNEYDAKIVFDKIMAAVRASGEKLYFVHTDNPYDFAIGANTYYAYNFGYSIDWMQRIVDFGAQVRSYGLRFGVIFNSQRGGQGQNYSISAGDDQLFYNDTLAFIREYQKKGGTVDDILLESWYQHPDKFFPEDQPYTFSNLVKMVFSFKCPAGESCISRGQGAKILADNFKLQSNIPTTPSFSDVFTTMPFYQAVETFLTKRITTGCSSNPMLFCPNRLLTRAETVTFLLRIANYSTDLNDTTPQFNDVPPNHPLFSYIQLFGKLGFTQGCSQSPLKFCPDDPIREEDLYTFITQIKSLQLDPPKLTPTSTPTPPDFPTFLNLFKSYYNKSNPPTTVDLNNNGIVEIFDYNMFMGNLGK